MSRDQRGPNRRPFSGYSGTPPKKKTTTGASGRNLLSTDYSCAIYTFPFPRDCRPRLVDALHYQSIGPGQPGPSREKSTYRKQLFLNVILCRFVVRTCAAWHSSSLLFPGLLSQHQRPKSGGPQKGLPAVIVCRVSSTRMTTFRARHGTRFFLW